MKIALFLFWIIIFSGCIKPDRHIGYDGIMYFDDSEINDKKTLVSRVFNDDIVGLPTQLDLIDTLLIANDTKTDSIFHFFSIHSGMHLGKFVSKGSGPNDLISCSNISVLDSDSLKSFWAFDITRRRFVEYCLEELLQNKVDKRYNNVVDFKLQNNELGAINEVFWIGKDSLLCRSFNQYKQRFLILDKNAGVLKEVSNDRMSIYYDNTNVILADMFSSKINIKPDRSRVVVVGRYFDFIEIYDQNGFLLFNICGPMHNTFMSFDEGASNLRGSLVKSEESRRQYLQVKTTNQNIYLLYSGKEKQDISHYSYSDIIYVLDWEGNPLKRLKLDRQIADFVIDDYKNRLLALSKDGIIISYDLD